MFVKVLYLFMFYFVCYVTDISIDMSEEHVAEEIDPELNEEEDIRLGAIMEEHWRNVSEEGDDKKKIHGLIWEV